jgi:hypothetical protein
MSLRVAMLIAYVWDHGQNWRIGLWKLYCFLDAFGNVKQYAIGCSS